MLFEAGEEVRVLSRKGLVSDATAAAMLEEAHRESRPAIGCCADAEKAVLRAYVSQEYHERHSASLRPPD